MASHPATIGVERAPSARRLRAAARLVLATATFGAAWSLLNLLVNTRHPAPETAWWFLVPSLDVTVVLGVFALLGWRGVRPRVWPSVAVTVVVLVIRLVRAGDGLVGEVYFRSLNMYLDVPMLPELARLLRSTTPLPRLLLGAALGLAGLVALALLTFHAAERCRRYLAAGRVQRWLFVALVAPVLAASPWWPDARTKPLRTGLFGASAVPVLAQQVAFAVAAADLRRRKLDEIREVQARLRQTPSALERLAGADVLLFFIESYGVTVLRDPAFRARVSPACDAFTRTLAQHGYAAASALLVSPTYGGGSWFAHATLASGVRTTDGLEYAVLRQVDPPPRTLASFFAGAGYRTVLVQPGTTRPWPEGLVHGFQRKYYAFDLPYRGPAFGWATMTDQYVVDFVHRQELERPGPPRFIEYALVSSHAPWTPQPPIVEDWARVGDGSVYAGLPQQRFPVTWANLHEGAEAYAAAMSYELEVLRRYLAQIAGRRALVIVLGDHQPVGRVIGNDPAKAVPIHVISRDRGLVELFTGRGYVEGFMPALGAEAQGMETFLPDLLARLSRAP